MTLRLARATRALTAAVGVAALLIGSAATPAAARPWPDDSAQPHGVVVNSPDAPATATRVALPLRRVGAHLVRGDNLTGAGVPAPAWITELTE